MIRFRRLVLHWLADQFTHDPDGGTLQFPTNYRSTIHIVLADRRV